MLVNNESQCVLTSRIGCKAGCKANTVAEKWNYLNGKSNVNQWFPPSHDNSTKPITCCSDGCMVAFQ